MKNNKQLFSQISSLNTEQRNSRSYRIDVMQTGKILYAINREDQLVAQAVRKEIQHIKTAVDIVVKALGRTGRLIYVGAGTSGRLGILDAAECPPTYGTDPAKVVGIIAGGQKAVFRSQEGSEDKAQMAIRDIRSVKVSTNDVVCGIAASSRTPYVVAAIVEAKRRGAKTILITTNPRYVLKSNSMRKLYKNIDVAICPVVGPEIIMGSTRMKSGTAQKLVLNMITTAAMIRLGKVYENMMVDLKMNSRKLEERAKRVLMLATGVDYEAAVDILSKADGHVKTAIVMIKREVGAIQARALLKKANGFVRLAIKK
jgi:N-acetylmuramic acid 6-phosphate etherase